MYQKLDNAAWEKYINEYSSLEEKTSIKSFCKERNINPSQFFYHRKRITSADKPVVLQAINFKYEIMYKERSNKFVGVNKNSPKKGRKIPHLRAKKLYRISRS